MSDPANDYAALVAEAKRLYEERHQALVERDRYKAQLELVDTLALPALLKSAAHQLEGLAARLRELQDEQEERRERLDAYLEGWIALAEQGESEALLVRLKEAWEELQSEKISPS